MSEINLSESKPGDVATVAGREWIVLERFENGTVAAVTKELIGERVFDEETNNFAESALRKWLNEKFADGLKDLAVPHATDLTADDGLHDYGGCKQLVGLLTCDQYRRYVEILDKYNPHDRWWLATPYSTPAHRYSSCVRIVYYDGTLYDGGCNFDYVCVRPFCIFKSSIFES